MNIQEAVLAAVKEEKPIRRKEWPRVLMMYPTDTPECCILWMPGKEPGPRWEPCAEDLTADDWEVYEGPDPWEKALEKYLDREREITRSEGA